MSEQGLLKGHEKPWGLCFPMVMGHSIQLDRLLVYAGGFSSLHYHEQKWNLFFVESGELDIWWLKHGGPATLKAGDHVVVPPGWENVHQFHCRQQTVLFEFYWQQPGDSPLQREEIVRLTENGRGEFVRPTWELAEHGRARLPQ